MTQGLKEKTSSHSWDILRYATRKKYSTSMYATLHSKITYSEHVFNVYSYTEFNTISNVLLLWTLLLQFIIKDHILLSIFYRLLNIIFAK